MGTSLSVDGHAPLHTFTSSKSWIEGSAVEQLKSVAALAGVSAVAGMPDLHPGKYGPVGCAVLADDIHPALVGGDIGCGMALFALDLPGRRVDATKAAARLRALAEPWQGDIAAARASIGLDPTGFDASLGSIGGGNHFCELQVIGDIVDDAAAAAAGLDRDRAFLLVHSGSRGLGTSIIERTLANGLVALKPDSIDGRRYLADHDAAVRWARLNRRIIAERAATALRTEAILVADLAHNMVEISASGALHRKGAAPADRGLVPVPGSRGTLSYLMRPLADAPATALASLAHGAGRKYDRASMHGRTSDLRSGAQHRSKAQEDNNLRSDAQRRSKSPTKNSFGGVVVCENRDMLIEEAPEAYKNIAQVIGDLESHGLARAVATFKPIVTFKSVVEKQDRRDKAKHRERGSDKRTHGFKREVGR